MIRIFLDGTEINSDNYVSIKNTWKHVENNFYLGSTASNTMEIELPRSCFSTFPLSVQVYEDSSLYGSFLVDSYEISNNNIVKFNLVDNMVLFNVPYDASGIVPCTVKEILEDICLQCGVGLGTETFTNKDLEVNYYDNSKNARDYISYIAELNGGYARIGRDGQLYLEKYDNTPTSISTDLVEEFIVGNKVTIERVCFNNGTLFFESSSDTSLETLYLNTENVYINDQTTFDNIANGIIGLELYSVDASKCQIQNVLCGDLIEFTDGTNTYQTIAQYDLDYFGNWIGGYKFEIQSTKQEETKIIGVSDKIKNIDIKVNRQDNKINQVVTQSQEVKDELDKLDLGGYALKTDLNNIITRINQVEQEQTDTYTKTEIREILKGEFIDSSGEVVPEIVKTLSATIDMDGLTIDKTDSPTSSKLDEKGFYIKDSNNQEILKAGYETYIDSGGNEQSRTIVRARDMQVSKYLEIEPVRFEKYTKDYEDSLGCFWLK